MNYVTLKLQNTMKCVLLKKILGDRIFSIYLGEIMGKRGKRHKTKKDVNNKTKKKINALPKTKNSIQENVIDASNQIESDEDSGQVNLEEVRNKEQAVLKESPKTYYGLPAKTWAIISLWFVGTIYVVFLVFPFILGLISALINKDMETFLNEIDGFTIFISIIGTIASVASIIMTLIDKQRFSEEKQHTKELFSEVADLKDVLSAVTNNIGIIRDESQDIKLEVLEIKNRISTEVKNDIGTKWENKDESKEIEDDKSN